MKAIGGRYGYREMETPLFEVTAVFERGIGEDLEAKMGMPFTRLVKVKPGEQHPNLQRWRAAMAERPSMSL